MLLVLIGVFPVGLHTRAGVVLCFGSDGHVELEDAAASDCVSASNRGSEDVHFIPVAEVTSFWRIDYDCGPCVDVVLLSNPLDGQRASYAAKQLVPEAPFIETAPVILPAAAATSVPVNPRGGAASFPILSLLRTIVLLV
jgi:hypothetical protein